jgi:hypothetical protein
MSGELSNLTCRKGAEPTKSECHSNESRSAASAELRRIGDCRKRGHPRTYPDKKFTAFVLHWKSFEKRKRSIILVGVGKLVIPVPKNQCRSFDDEPYLLSTVARLVRLSISSPIAPVTLKTRMERGGFLNSVNCKLGAFPGVGILASNY